MTKKHFEALAIALASVRPAESETASPWGVWTVCKDAIADVCKEANPRFDRDRFNSACRDYQTAIRDGQLVRVRS